MGYVHMNWYQRFKSIIGTSANVLSHTDMMFQSDGTLTLVGCAEMQRRILSYCKSHGYPPWGLYYQEQGHTAERIAKWRLGLLAVLSELLTATVWVRNFNDSDGKQQHFFYLNQTEGHLSALWRSRPTLNQPVPTIASKLSGHDLSWKSEPIQSLCLAEFLVSDKAFNSLVSRCRKHAIAAYTVADYLAVHEQARKSNGRVISMWSSMNGEHAYVGLMAVTQKNANDLSVTTDLFLPSVWGKSLDDTSGFGSFGKDLEIDPNGYFVVQDANGRYQFAQLLNFEKLPDEVLGEELMARARVCISSSYAYLYAFYCRSGFYEVSEHDLTQDACGDWICDIVTKGGVIVNGSEAKALAGSLNHDGCVLKRTITNKRLLGWLPLGDGAHSQTDAQNLWQRTKLFWADVRDMGDQRRAVKDADSGLWGFLNENEDMVVPPRFAQVGLFYANICWATLPEDPQRRGLINRQGEWLTSRQWRYITWQNARLVIVQSFDDEWGVISFADRRHKDDSQTPPTCTIPIQNAQVWLDAFDAEQNDPSQRRGLDVYVSDPMGKSREEKIMQSIDRVSENKLFALVQQAKTEPSLVSLNGQFEGSLTVQLLMQIGLWGISVRVLSDQRGGLPICAGETGTIFTQYPVSLSCFDINQEAPVMGLSSAPEGVKGVHWGDLCFVGTNFVQA